MLFSVTNSLSLLSIVQCNVIACEKAASWFMYRQWATPLIASNRPLHVHPTYLLYRAIHMARTERQRKHITRYRSSSLRHKTRNKGRQDCGKFWTRTRLFSSFNIDGALESLAGSPSRRTQKPHPPVQGGQSLLDDSTTTKRTQHISCEVHSSMCAVVGRGGREIEILAPF